MRKSNKSIPPSSGTTNNSKSVRTPKVTKESIVEKERLSINDILKTKVKIKCKNAKQKEMLRLVEEKEVSIVSGVAGCLASGTEVLMYDGTFKEAQDIVINDQLMGVDSKPRNVLELVRGEEQMYVINQKKGDPYKVNGSHILSLKIKTPIKYRRFTNENSERCYDYSAEPYKGGESSVVNISVTEYLNLTKNEQKNLKGYISDKIEFPEKDLLIDPYYLGLWLGDGATSDIKKITTTDEEIIKYLNQYDGFFTSGITYVIRDNETYNFNSKFKELFGLTNLQKLGGKYIPHDYLVNSTKNRLALLAGLIDSDGWYRESGKSYQIIQKNKELADGITFLCRSLGFRTILKPKIAKMKRKDGSVYECEVYRIEFTPDIDIPVKIERKTLGIRVINKDFRVHGIQIEKNNVDNYFGFKLDGDNLFILKDFTVTHNCGKTFLAIAKALELIQDQTTLYTRLVITKPIVEAEENLGFLPGGLEEKLSPHMASSTNIIDEIIGSANRIRLTELGIIVVEPLAFLRGKTLSNCVLVADEMQNASPSQLKTLMTRIGENSKYIISGDIDQSDRYYDVKQSGLYDIIKRFVDIEEIGHVEFELEDIVRNPLIAKILATYSKSDSIIKKPLLLE